MRHLPRLAICISIAAFLALCSLRPPLTRNSEVISEPITGFSFITQPLTSCSPTIETPCIERFRKSEQSADAQPSYTLKGANAQGGR